MAGGDGGLQAIRQFLESGGPGWNVKHADGSSEPFDGGKLIASLISAEVPTAVAIGMYGEFLEACESRVEDGFVRLADVRNLVTTLLMRLPQGDRSLWLSNYEHLFAMDRSYPDRPDQQDPDPRYIDASDNRALRSFLSELVRERLEAGSVHGELGAVAVDDAVTRLTRIVRLCGFFRIPRSFLRELVEALADHSSKLVVPDTIPDAQTRRNALDTADDLLGAANLYAQSGEHRSSVGTALLLALAPACTAFLREMGFMPRVGPEHVLRQFAGILEAGYARSRDEDQELSLDTPSLMFTRVESQLESVELTGREFVDLSRRLIRDVGLDEGTPDVPLIARDEATAMETISSARRLLVFIRVALGEASELMAVRDDLARDIAEAPGSISRLLSSHGLAPVSEAHEWGNTVTVALDRRSDFGRLGSSLEMLVTDEPRQALGGLIRSFVGHLRDRPGSIALLACTSLDPPAPGERAGKVEPTVFRELRQLAGAGGPVVVPIPATQLLRMLTHGADFFDQAADAVSGTFPALATNAN